MLGILPHAFRGIIRPSVKAFESPSPCRKSARGVAANRFANMAIGKYPLEEGGVPSSRPSPHTSAAIIGPPPTTKARIRIPTDQQLLGEKRAPYRFTRTLYDMKMPKRTERSMRNEYFVTKCP